MSTEEDLQILEMEEYNMRIIIPKELIPYIRLRDGEIIVKKEIPNELKDLYEKFKAEYQEMIKMKNQCF